MPLVRLAASSFARRHNGAHVGSLLSSCAEVLLIQCYDMRIHNCVKPAGLDAIGAHMSHVIIDACRR